MKHVTHLPPSPSATAAGSPESSKPDSPTKIDALKVGLPLLALHSLSTTCANIVLYKPIVQLLCQEVCF